MARLHLYVSIDPNLEAEREAVARAVARFPVSLAWQISFTPFPEEAGAPDSELVRSAAFFVAVLGVDIKAPMGWELMLARSAGLQPLAYAKQVGRTLAATAFYRGSRLVWAGFESAAELGSHVQRELARRLVANPAVYGLTAVEWQTLHGYLEDDRDGQRAEDDPSWEGAGRGGVILSPGHDIPEGAVLLKGDRIRQEADGE